MTSRSFVLALLATLATPAAAIYPHTPPLAPPGAPRIQTSQAFLTASLQVEADPVGEQADALRGPMMRWIEETDEVMVTLCEDLAPLIKPEPVKAILMFEYMMDSAVYQIKNPAASTRRAQVAGLQGVIERYLDFRKTYSEEMPAIAYVDGLVRDFSEHGLKGLEKHTCDNDGSTGNGEANGATKEDGVVDPPKEPNPAVESPAIEIQGTIEIVPSSPKP